MTVNLSSEIRFDVTRATVSATVLFLCAFALFVPAFASDAKTSASKGGKSGFQTIDVAQAYQLYTSGAQFVDTRTWFEMSMFGKIDGALAMRDRQVFDVAEHVLPDKQRQVVLYCAVGVRASHAADKLRKMGYASVYVLGNGEGFSNWKKAGLPVSK